MREELSSVGCFIPSNYVPETFIFLFAAIVFAYIDNSTSQHAFAWNAQVYALLNSIQSKSK